MNRLQYKTYTYHLYIIYYTLNEKIYIYIYTLFSTILKGLGGFPVPTTFSSHGASWTQLTTAPSCNSMECNDAWQFLGIPKQGEFLRRFGYLDEIWIDPYISEKKNKHVHKICKSICILYISKSEVSISCVWYCYNLHITCISFVFKVSFSS